MSKTPIELFHDWLSALPHWEKRCYGCACQGFQAGYHSRDEEVAKLKEEIAMLKADLREVGNE